MPYLALSVWPAIIARPPEEVEEVEDGDEAPEVATAEAEDDPEAPEAAAQEAEDDAEAPTGEGYSLTFSKEDNVGVLTREDFYYVTFDCDTDVIDFWDYDAFMRLASGQFLIDMLGSGINTDSDDIHYFRRNEGSYERYGKEVIINAGDYGIDFIAQGDECFVPMQTLSDILLSYYGINIYYNSEAAFIATSESFGDSDALTPMGELYYSVQPHALSETMAEFTYNELCLVLDTLYGLKDNHDIQRFEDLADDTALRDSLMSTDPVEADAALFMLLEHHLDDQHTAFNLPSPLSGYASAKSFKEDMAYGQSTIRFWQQANPYTDARKVFYPDGIPAYEEVSNTAFITFDDFITIPQGVDYYQTPPTEAVTDTIGIMIYAYSQITRPDSPIENVVLDMSCNLGATLTPLSIPSQPSWAPHPSARRTPSPARWSRATTASTSTWTAKSTKMTWR